MLVLSQPLAQATHDAPSPRALKVLVTPCDPMSCGLDVTQVRQTGGGRDREEAEQQPLTDLGMPHQPLTNGYADASFAAGGQAETPEAVTVLQLLQDIDVGSYLRHDTLAGLVGVKAGHPMALRRYYHPTTTDHRQHKGWPECMLTEGAGHDGGVGGRRRLADGGCGSRGGLSGC